jgi:hypothetical protein
VDYRLGLILNPHLISTALLIDAPVIDASVIDASRGVIRKADDPAITDVSAPTASPTGYWIPASAGMTGLGPRPLF